MKLQGLSVVFALIVLPLILVLTYYIQLQVDSIGLQNKYDSYLLNSTHDAMSSFEINTANEDLSSVSDSLRSIIEASSNIFFNTLSTKLGMSNASKSYVEPYVPAILYTLYDGYYIYSPTKVPTVLTDTDGNAVSVGDIGVSGVENGGKMVYKYTNPEAPEGYLKYTDIPDAQKSEYGQLLYLKGEAADGSKIYTANIDEAKFNVKNVLKTYMPYSARYQTADGNKDITVIYTLDNFITIQGTIKSIGGKSTYYTKSGYLLPRDDSGKVTCVDINTASGVELLKYSGDIITSYYNQNDAEKYIKQGNEVTVTIGGDISITSGGATFVANTGVNTYDEAIEKLNSLKKRLNNAQTLKAQRNKGIIDDEDESIINFLDKYSYAHISGSTNLLKIEKAIKNITTSINNIQYELDKMSACIYYVNATIFSNWVYGNLDDIQASDLVEISGQSYKSINGTEEVISQVSGKIFDVKGSTTEGVIEIDEDSPFYTNKLNVIRNSIQYNLNSAMSTYNAASASTNDYSMPVLLNEEWEKILSNVSIVSFMQGYKCGLKTYNNYMIVSSTNNEIAVSPENIFYVEKDKFCDENTEYHRINCPDIPETEEYIAFTSKEVKYDKLYDKNNSSLPYTFDHRNLACYHCINDGNYKGTNIFDTSDANYGTDLYKKLRKAYYLGIAKCRNNLYKMNSVSESQGYEVIYNKPDDPAYISNTITSTSSSLSLGNIKTIELVLDTLKAKDPAETVVRYKVKIGDEYLNSEVYPIVTNVTSDYTLVINVDPSISSHLPITINSLKFENQLVAEGGESSVYATDYTGAELYTDILDINEKNTKILLNAVKYARVIYR